MNINAKRDPVPLLGQVYLKRETDAYERAGHPWIYKSRIARVSDAAPGDLVQVHETGRVLGTGYYNPSSEIAVRILEFGNRPFTADTLKEKITRAVRDREGLLVDTNAVRLVWSEADGLPGLIVDRYDQVLVVQFLTLGMERLKDRVLEALESAAPSRGVFEKSDSPLRKKEGLEARTGWLRRDCLPADALVAGGDETLVREHGLSFSVKFGEGHKTGLYLDQRENRILLAEGGRTGAALDGFCYTGGFGLHLARAGWTVTGIDSQPDVIELARKNAELNGLTGKAEFRAANVFEELKRLQKDQKAFDLIVLDPPSFVKSRGEIPGALSGYKEIALRSMKLLSPGGRLAVFSCSWHIDENLLMQACLSAAVDAHKGLRVLKFLKQAADHPIDPFIPETYYLKGFLLEVTDAVRWGGISRVL